MDYVFWVCGGEGRVVGVGSREVGDYGEGELGAWIQGTGGGRGEDEVGFGLRADCCEDGVACLEGCDDGAEA